MSSTGCADRINKIMSSWEGHHHSELRAAWGAPDREVSDGKDGKIIVYQFQRSGGNYGRVDQFGNFHSRHTGYTAKREFYVNKEGIIYSWRWQGY